MNEGKTGRFVCVGTIPLWADRNGKIGYLTEKSAQNALDAHSGGRNIVCASRRKAEDMGRDQNKLLGFYLSRICRPSVFIWYPSR